MRLATTAFLLASLAAGCLGHGPRALPPLEREGEVWVYVEPFSRGSERLSFTIGSISARRADGVVVPLRVRAADLSAEDRTERLLASGRLEPGSYVSFLVQVKQAKLAHEDGATDLLVPQEPARVDAAFSIAPRSAAVVVLSLRYGASVGSGFGLTPAFGAAIPDRPPPQLAGFCSTTGSHAVFEFDAHSGRAVAAIPTGAEPRGLAFDETRGRVYVAISGDDEVQALDAFTGAMLGRIQLRPGDRPGEVAITPDGRTVIALDTGTSQASFLDPAAMAETDRVDVGNDPAFLLLDRQGRRAYVVNRRSSSLTVLDVATHAVVATIRTEAEPIAVQLDRAGARLFVAHAGSQYLLAISLADFSVAKRAFIGLGATMLLSDARTDLLYVGRSGDDRLYIYDPASLLSFGSIELPGPPVRGTIRDAENLLLVAIRGGAVAAVDLTAGRVTAGLGVGDAPYQVVVAGARR